MSVFGRKLTSAIERLLKALKRNELSDSEKDEQIATPRDDFRVRQAREIARTLAPVDFSIKAPRSDERVERGIISPQPRIPKPIPNLLAPRRR